MTTMMGSRTGRSEGGLHSAPRPLPWLIALLLAVHGAIHVLGLLLLWHVTETAELSYADSVLVPGSLPAVLAGVGWAVAGVAFVVAGALCARRSRHGRRMALGAAVLSLPLMFTAAPAPFGVLADVLVLGLAWWVRPSKGVGR